ncbi:MAG: hypothetical protein E7350_03735 [Clostridiales bacterium]|nr:hypothetical protein [Clostridiales bacterium]
MFTKKHKKLLVSINEEIKQIKSLVTAQGEEIDRLKKLTEENLITMSGEGEAAKRSSYGSIIVDEIDSLSKKLEEVSRLLHKKNCEDESAAQNEFSLLELKSDLVKLAQLLED